jgi:hypothetical protein
MIIPISIPNPSQYDVAYGVPQLNGSNALTGNIQQYFNTGATLATLTLLAGQIGIPSDQSFEYLAVGDGSTVGGNKMVVIRPALGTNCGGGWLTNFGDQDANGINYAGGSQCYEDGSQILHLNGGGSGVRLDDQGDGVSFGGEAAFGGTIDVIGNVGGVDGIFSGYVTASGGILSTGGSGGGSLISQNTATTSNSGTSETLLWGPAAGLVPSSGTGNKVVRLSATVTLSGTARAKEIRVRLANSSGVTGTIVADTGAATPGGSATIKLSVSVQMISATEAIATFESLTQNGVSFSPTVPSITTVSGLTSGDDIYLNVTGQVGSGGTTNDINMGPGDLLGYS